ncbi:MAG: histidine phosphatase family protein [Selenomonadaceae bacterium]|nr:histidine phosphatase family protein [Selenomonadaceae bacterium]
MIRIFLIRHGETEWNALGKLQGTSNVQLSAVGIHQAKLLAAHAPFNTADAIYSSDLIRARSTAEILAQRFNLKVRVMLELREANFGDWEGHSIKELAEDLNSNFETFFTAPEICHPPHGETSFDCQTRVVGAIKKIVAENKSSNDKRIIVISHGAAIRLFLCWVLGMPIRKMWALSQFNMALNVLRVDDGNITVELLNSTLHLYNF